MAVATKSVSLGNASIGPSSWRNETMKSIKESQNVIKVSDKSTQRGKCTDPLPNLREVVAELSNDEAHRHFRQTRAVVCQLRDGLISTNEEIKSLTRAKEAVEKAIENVRKDIKLNAQSQNLRKSRPVREKEHDSADDLLKAEKMHLLNQKKRLESQLQLVQQQLQTLDKCRQRLAAVTSERSRVLDLVSHALPSTSFSARASMSRPRNTSRVSMSADFNRSGGFGSSMGTDPLGAFTPEAESALEDAANARDRSAMLRRDVANSIDTADKVQRSTLKSVNSGLTGKIGETVSLKQNLDVASGENRNAINRAHRWYDHTEKAWRYSQGPNSYSDLGARERLDRPIIKTFQRHPGTNLPEAQKIVKGGDGLLESLHSTGRNIGLLKLAHLKLKDDILDKKTAIDIDSSIVRMRRSKSNHRWVMGQAF